MKNKLLLFILLVCANIAYSQHQERTVFYSRVIKDPEFFNPAYNAYQSNLSSKLIFNDKLHDYEGSPISYGFSLSVPIVKSKLGSVFNVVNELVGMRQIITVNAGLNTCVKVSEHGILSGGINLGQRRLEYLVDKMEAYSDIDITKIDIKTTKTIFSFGFYYVDLFSFAGLSVSDIVLKEVDLLNNFDLYCGRNIPLSEKMVFTPTVLYKKFYGDEITNVTGMIHFNQQFGLGGHYTVGNDYGFMAELRISKDLWLGYIYEQYSKTGWASSSSHGISLSYNVDHLRHLFDNIKRYQFISKRNN